MNTTLALMAVYNGPTVHLDKICKEYFGLERADAMKKAAVAELPVPVFRLHRSQKAPYIVHIKDLADLIDKQRENADKTWQRCQV